MSKNTIIGILVLFIALQNGILGIFKSTPKPLPPTPAEIHASKVLAEVVAFHNKWGYRDNHGEVKGEEVPKMLKEFRGVFEKVDDLNDKLRNQQWGPNAYNTSKCYDLASDANWTMLELLASFGIAHRYISPLSIEDGNSYSWHRGTAEGMNMSNQRLHYKVWTIENQDLWFQGDYAKELGDALYQYRTYVAKTAEKYPLR